MVELLKQPQYQPMHVIDQVLSIYAGTRGYLDQVPVSEVSGWEREFLQFMHDRKGGELWKKLEALKDLVPELENELKTALEEFKLARMRRKESVV